MRNVYEFKKILENHEFKKGFLQFVKIHDFPIFHCFECKLYFYLRTAFIYNKLLQTVHVACLFVSMLA